MEFDRRAIAEYNNDFPIGLIAGPALTLGNIVSADTSNRKFKSELDRNELVGSTIKKGKTAYGLITIKPPSFDALHLQLPFSQGETK